MNWKLKEIVWEITLACPFQCRYCGSKAGSRHAEELSTSEMLDIARQIVGMQVKRVVLIGGEVFVRADWSEIARVLTEGGVKVSIITNGYEITDKDLAAIKECSIQAIGLSLDSTEELHDRYRRKGSYARVLKVLSRLRAANIPCAIVSTLNQSSIENLPALWEQIKGMDIYAWQIQACINSGNAAGQDFAKPLDSAKIINFIESCNKEIAKNNLSMYVTAADNIGYCTKEEWIRLTPYKGCAAGLSICGIDSLGNVTGCEAMKDPIFHEGNLRTQSLKEIWENPDNFSYNRRFTPSLLTGRCADCPQGRVCAGGCRATNYFHNTQRMYENQACAFGKQETGGIVVNH